MPILFKGSLYNARVWVLDGQILLIRPKIYMAGGNNYRENRYFVPWKFGKELFEYQLPDEYTRFFKDLHKTTQIGVAVVKANDTELASEICEEIWVPQNIHVELCLDGVEIIANASASHHELRKLDKRLQLIRACSARNECVYMYANQKGGDGGRLYFDGTSLVAVNGDLVAQLPQFSLDDVEVSLSIIDLEQVRARRAASMSRGNQAGIVKSFARVHADIDICCECEPGSLSKIRPAAVHDPLEEIALGPPIWMWDYLRRSGSRGFFIALSGGADSASVAAMVASMAFEVFKSVEAGNTETLRQLRKVVKLPDFKPNKY